jgi:hypothetical protein
VKKNILRNLAVAAAASLALGGAAATGIEVAQPKPAEATIIATYVASTSEHTMRMCDVWNGRGLCNNVRPGHWSKYLVDSIQVDRGCELWMSGVRKAQRKDHDWWWNSVAIYSKKTVRLSNCR